MGFQIDKATRLVNTLVQRESYWVKQLCKEMVAYGIAPEVWDENVYNKIRDPKHFRSARIARRCDRGYYKNIAKRVYAAVDIYKFTEELNGIEHKEIVLKLI